MNKTYTSDGSPAETHPATGLAHVEVNQRAADRIAAGHPWIFTSDVVKRGAAEPGSAVRVLGPRHKPLGTAHYSSTSQITLRLLSKHTERIDLDFFRGRLERAAAYRQQIAPGVDAYRLVHGEADQLPALIVDRYGPYFVVQTLDQGMDAAKGQIVEALTSLFSPAGIVERNDVSVRSREGLAEIAGVIAGTVPDEVEFNVNGLRFGARLLSGQKTGIFLDQRENYLAAQRVAGSLPHRGPALDCCTYTGGFALHLAGAVSGVEAIDSSANALETARANAARNGISNVEFRQADMFELLGNYASARRKFSIVVLDPPAFAKSRSHLQQATRGYRDINLRALRLLEPGGILVTCSCSHHLSEGEFLQLVAEASIDAGRTLRVLDRRTQALDHPILLTVPETHYLKCLILQVL